MRAVLSLAAALLATASGAASPFGEVAPVADAELASMRGGVLLPNGLDLSVGVAIETRVDGRLALRTTVSTDGGLRVFVGGAGDAAMVPQAAPEAGPMAAPAGPMVRIDRNGAGTVIAPAAALPNIQVGVTRGPVQDAASGGGAPVAVTANGVPVATPFGNVSLEQSDRGSIVLLNDPTLQLRHLVGSATGFAVANTADNRAIDTVANVDIDLRNASVLIGGNLLRIDAIVTDAVTRNGF